MQLYVLARPVQQVQEAINNLVLADSLIAHQQQMLAQQEIFQHVFHDVQVLESMR